MKADWDTLAGEYASSPTVLIGDVDCTSEGGKPKCEEMGVKGYPTIKYGDPSDLQDYKAGRDMASLRKFATELGPMCSPANLDLCDAKKTEMIKEFSALSAEKREAMIKEEEDKIATAEKEFVDHVADLRQRHKSSTEEKDSTIAAIRASGLGLLKAVHSHEKERAEKSDEL